ncbi:MAG: nucleotidyltransferase domain-containing protein [Candidatus Aenigmarchaeota archaeon]|nr:nucleotidyltransferase domain-containing protein [Candidatus Aenigmarchaeota archaeon]
MKLIVRKKYFKFYFETAVQKVLQVFFRFPDKEFSLSDVAKVAGVAKANIGMILKKLYGADLIQITKLAKIWRIKANQRSWYFIRSKIVYNLNFVYQSSIIEFLNDYFKNPKAIVLFGSFRKGEDVTGSDIDIAIETDESVEYTTTGLRELAEFEKLIGRKIQIHLFNRTRIDINVFNNIANGIVLSGFVEVKP